MKLFLTRACRKIVRFFWSWGFLKFVLVCVTLVILLYVEEDWRGARAWAATKAKWEAKGETFDLNKFTPPPVPDDENLAAIPVFKMEPDPHPQWKGALEPVALQKAFGNNITDDSFPPVIDWTRGELPDLGKIGSMISADYVKAFKSASPSNDSLTQLNALYPFLTDLRAVAATRPLCRFQYDDAAAWPNERSFELIEPQLTLSRILTLHAILALQNHQPDLALDDIKLNFKLMSGVNQDPSLYGAEIAIAMFINNGAAIYDGLKLHVWNDVQLADLQNELAQVDFLSAYQHAMRGDVAAKILTFDYIKIQPRSRFAAWFGFFATPAPPDVRNQESVLTIWFGFLAKGVNRDGFPYLPWPGNWLPYFPWPAGWLDCNKSLSADFSLREIRSVDTKTRLVNPVVVDALQTEARHVADRWDAMVPWKILSALDIANPVLEPVEKGVAEAQVWVDEERIACALERYRLAHGAYPDSLDVLAPAYIDQLPHDIINGQPYHYQLRPDGTFLLYSVGWNQTDDGGKVVYKKDASASVDYTQGDWVWPTPQATPAR